MLAAIFEVCGKLDVKDWWTLMLVDQKKLAILTRIAGFDTPKDWTTQNLPNVAKTFPGFFTVNKMQEKQIFARAVVSFLVVKLYGE